MITTNLVTMKEYQERCVPRAIAFSTTTILCVAPKTGVLSKDGVANTPDMYSQVDHMYDYLLTS